MVPVGEVEVGQRVGLRLLEHLGGLGAEPLDSLCGQLVRLANDLGVALGEDGLQDAEHGAPLLPGRHAARGVAHQVHDAALQRGTREDLLDRAL